MLDSNVNTSAAAFHQISNGGRSKLDAMILDVVGRAQRRGARDVSMKEVQAGINEAYGRWVELSSISGRVTLLVSGSKLQRTTEPRPCTVSGATVHALSLPMQQASFEARGYY